MSSRGFTDTYTGRPSSPPRANSPRRGIEALNRTAEDLIRLLTSMDPNILPSTIPEGAQLHSRSFARRPASRQKSSGWADMKSTLGEAAVPRSTLDGEWPSSRPSSRQSSRPSSRGGPSLSGDPGETAVHLATAGRALANLKVMMTTEREQRLREKDEYEWRIRQLEASLEAGHHLMRQTSMTVSSKEEKESATDYLIEALRRQLETEQRGRYQDRVELNAKVQDAQERRTIAVVQVEDFKGQLREIEAVVAGLKEELREERDVRRGLEGSLASTTGALAEERVARAAEVQALSTAHAENVARLELQKDEEIQSERLAREAVVAAKRAVESSSVSQMDVLEEKLRMAQLRIQAMEERDAAAKMTLGALESKIRTKDIHIEELERRAAAVERQLAEAIAKGKEVEVVYEQKLKSKVEENVETRKQLETAHVRVNAQSTQMMAESDKRNEREERQQKDLEISRATVSQLEGARATLVDQLQELKMEHTELQRKYGSQMAEIESQCQIKFEEQLQVILTEERRKADNALFLQRQTLRNEINQREGAFKEKLDNELADLRLQIESENASKMRRIEVDLERRIADERSRFERDLYTTRNVAREEVALMKMRVQKEHEELRGAKNEAERYKLQLVELLAKLQGLERTIVHRDEDLEQRKTEYETYLSDLKTKQQGELQTIQAIHGQRLTNMTIELERIKANAEINAKRLISQLRDQTTKTEEAVTYLQEARAQIHTLEATIEELRNEITALQKAHALQLRDLRIEYDIQLRDKEVAHVAEITATTTEYVAVIEKAQEREAVLQEATVHMERALDRKEPRPEDVIRIRQLEATIFKINDEYTEIKERLKAMKLEMLMREDTYTRRFVQGGPTEDSMAVANSLIANENLLQWMKVELPLSEAPTAVHLDPSFLEAGSPGGFFASSLRAATAPRKAPASAEPGVSGRRDLGTPSPPRPRTQVGAARTGSPPRWLHEYNTLDRPTSTAADSISMTATAQTHGKDRRGTAASATPSPAPAPAPLHVPWVSRRATMADAETIQQTRAALLKPRAAAAEGESEYHLRPSTAVSAVSDLPRVPPPPRRRGTTGAFTRDDVKMAGALYRTVGRPSTSLSITSDEPTAAVASPAKVLKVNKAASNRELRTQPPATERDAITKILAVDRRSSRRDALLDKIVSRNLL